MGLDSDSVSVSKSHLASEICSFSARTTVSCPHRHFSLPFLDWYRLLGVQEDAPIDSIRRRYLNLALQLHPDKNSHPKAEFAFKLVSQGYGCLSDNEKRMAFDLDRTNKFCPDCNTIPYTNFSNPLRRIRRRDMKERLREEANVIESCLRANTSISSSAFAFASAAASPPLTTTQTSLFKTHRETPIFNPSDYLCQGYPHFRTRIHPKPPTTTTKTPGNSFKYEQQQQGRGGKCEYPVFEISSRSRSPSFLVQKQQQSAFVYSSNENKSHC